VLAQLSGAHDARRGIQAIVADLIEEAEQARIKAMESTNGAAAAVSAITAKAKLAALWREKPEQTKSGPEAAVARAQSARRGSRPIT
jgi:hypothetical protein